jgi:hypothetical protein
VGRRNIVEEFWVVAGNCKLNSSDVERAYVESDGNS